jgi:glycosyltransferase involved in cell wall biosynthesis
MNLVTDFEANASKLVVGIDATNIRRGGGRSHLIELLRAALPQKYNIDRVVIWAAKDTLDLIGDSDWLVKRNPSALNSGFFHRTGWQRYCLSKEARAEGCDMLFVPGGSFAGDFHPIIAMSQNMLPFETSELRRFGCSLTTLRLLLLRRIQSRSFRRADGIIFLSDYARNRVQQVTGKFHGQVKVIPHGLNNSFRQSPRIQYPIRAYSTEQPLRILYVSTITLYKHQWAVVEALGRLRERTNWPLALDIVGSGYPPAVRRLNKTLARWDPDCAWVRCCGCLKYKYMHKLYKQADVGVFASSCENMPLILLEAMAAGLPIASSNSGPMPEVLGSAGVYFDALSPASIEASLEHLISSRGLRRDLAQRSFARAQTYCWERCADQTFAFLAEVASGYTGLSCGA